MLSLLYKCLLFSTSINIYLVDNNTPRIAIYSTGFQTNQIFLCFQIFHHIFSGRKGSPWFQTNIWCLRFWHMSDAKIAHIRIFYGDTVFPVFCFQLDARTWISQNNRIIIKHVMSETVAHIFFVS